MARILQQVQQITSQCNHVGINNFDLGFLMVNLCFWVNLYSDCNKVCVVLSARQ